MNTKALLLLALGAAVWAGQAVARADSNTLMSTPPATIDDKLAMYDATVEARTVKILSGLALGDAAVSNRVHAAIVAHYHALHARDEAINYELARLDKGSDVWVARHLAMFPVMSAPIHQAFLDNLKADLTPAQIETIEDRMTYGKVAFTYNAYCSILPNLTDEEKAHVLDQLKQAREVAVDGGSSLEKTAIFQNYKNQINAYLHDRGYDVAQATKDWVAKTKTAAK